MFVCETASVNDKNHLTIGGCDCVELAEKYGTPLYVLDEDLIRKYCRKYKDALDSNYNGNGIILYASKALCISAMCKIADEEGLGLDVVSGGELFTAKKAGFPMDKIYFHGNNKSPEELVMAVKYGVKRIVVDNFEELARLDAISTNLNKKVSVSFRLKPGIDAHTHDFIQTGKIDSKFGVPIEGGEALKLIKTALAMKNIVVDGIHCHIGSQIFDLEPFDLAAKIMLKFIKEIKDETGHDIGELNLGGGYGIKYTQQHDPVDMGKYIGSIAEVVKADCQKYGLKLPFIVMEPGRSIVAPAGITLYTVGAVKKIDDNLTYVLVDGGMADNPRYALYEAKYEAVNACRAGDGYAKAYTLAGKCCESGDLLGKDIMLQETKADDIVAVLATGAYNYSMSSNYNRLPRPPIVMVSGGKSRLVLKRETYEDVIRNDILP